ncbi:phospholipid:diacylglycerol acyltransferase [Naganishia albida]|nr:phospholipid:diacylglycerol acyltransferase [Naganishia albida]
MESPTPKSNYARRRKSARAVTEVESPDASPPKVSKGKGRAEREEEPEHVSRLDLSALKDKLGEGLEDLTVKLHATGDGQYKLLAPGTPLHELNLAEALLPSKKGSPQQDAKKSAKKTRKAARSWKSWAFGRKFFFPAGIVLGLAVSAVVFTPLSNIPPEILESLYTDAGNLDMRLPDMKNMMSGMKFPSFDFDLRELANNLTVVQQTRKVLTNRNFEAGRELAMSEGVKAHHPIILIPGIVSTGLESWSTSEENKGFFRKRLWGTSTMVQAVLSDKKRWIEAISLDPETGLDPEGHKVRAAQGLDAASEFIQGYWVWQPIVQNLAAIGYDTNAMEMASYDWRLSYMNLEIRDAYFTRLKRTIETFKKTTGQKSVLASHSMGGTVVMYFLKWVEAMPEDDIDGMGFGGGGGPGWVEEYVSDWVNIAGTLLGVSKSMTAFLSGEMKDTVEIHPAGSWVLEKFFSRKERAGLFRKWPGSSSMWMKGTDRIWGNHEAAPDDPEDATDTHGRFFSFRETTDSEPSASQAPAEGEFTPDTPRLNLTMNEAGEYILTHTPNSFQKMLEGNYSNGFETDVQVLKENAKNHRKWTNPLEVQLPNAPSLRIHCMYGYGKPTERSYWYMQGEFEHDEVHSEGLGGQCTPDELIEKANGSLITCRTPLDMPSARRHWIDTEITVQGSVPEVKKGVKFGEGDGTVPLLSLGAMCVRGWKDPKWNPAGIKVVTKEFKHEPEALDLRGGARTGDHIDILGSTGLNQAVLRVAAGRGADLKDEIISNITSYADKIDWTS